MFLRQSTSQTIRFGPCLDISDGVTEETGLTLAQADMRLSKDGGAFAQKNASGNATHDSDGWYSTTLNTTDTNTVGELILNVHQPANMLPVWMRFWVVEEVIYDAVFGASAAGFDANQRVDVGAVLGTAQTAGDIMASVGGVTAAAAAGDPSTAESVMQYVKQIVNLIVGAAGAATFPAEQAPANGVNLLEVVRAIHADVTGLAGAAMRGTDGANTTTPPTVGAIADAVWDEPVSGHTAAGTVGNLIERMDLIAAGGAGELTAARAGNLDNLDGSVAAVETDTQDIQSRLPAALVSGRMSADAVAISGSTGAADSVESNIGNLDAAVSAVETDTQDIQSRIPAVAPVEGTADSGSTTTMVDAARAETDDYWNGQWILFTSGNLNGFVALVTDFVASTDTMTFQPAAPNAVGTHTYRMIPASHLLEVLTLTGHTVQTGDSFARLGAPAGASVSADVAAVQADTDNIQTRIPTALVGGRIDADVGNMQTDVVDADALATDAATEIRDHVLPTQNTALNNIMFLFVAASDGQTPVTGATGTAVQRSIDGGSFATAGGTLAEVSNGMYQFDASAGDMNGGVITFRFSATGGTPGAPLDTFVTIVTTGGV